MNNFRTRFLSGLLYALLITVSVFYSKISFKVLITIFSTIVLKEYFNLTNFKNHFFLILTLFFIWAPRYLITNNYLIMNKNPYLVITKYKITAIATNEYQIITVFLALFGSNFFGFLRSSSVGTGPSL